MYGGPRSRKGMVTVLGALNWDTTLFLHGFARPGEEVPVLDSIEGPGGKGGNVAVAAARILGKQKVALVGAVGRDMAGERLIRSLTDEGVDAAGVVSKDTRTGHAFVLVDHLGRKTIHTDFGANNRLSPRDLRLRGARDAISRSGVVIIMDVPVATGIEAARVSKESGARVILNPGVRCRQGVAPLRAALSVADSLVVNENELFGLCGTERPDRAFSLLQEEFPGLTVVSTSGPRGAAVSSIGKHDRIAPLGLPELGLKVVNSTGAGDAFLAAYAAYRLRGANPVVAARWGNLAGALKSTRNETRGSPTRKELESIMPSYSKQSHSHY
jgi:ribokinase